MDGPDVRDGRQAGHELIPVDSEMLESLYEKLNRRAFVHPDPLEFLYAYEDPSDREIVGLLASSLAYGRVKQILASVSDVLGRLGPAPAAFVRDASKASLSATLAGFKHRFTTGDDLARMLSATSRVLDEHGTLGRYFVSLLRREDETVVPALTAFAQGILSEAGGGACPLPDPERGSACKRLHLYLRWMVRRDDVDPGGWEGVSPSRLVVPLDTHMHRLSRLMGLTERKQADLTTALQITEGFRRFRPDDPVRYDFSLTRLGIRDDLNAEALLGRPIP